MDPCSSIAASDVNGACVLAIGLTGAEAATANNKVNMMDDIAKAVYDETDAAFLCGQLLARLPEPVGTKLLRISCSLFSPSSMLRAFYKSFTCVACLGALRWHC